jgi:antitoxin HicB
MNSTTRRPLDYYLGLQYPFNVLVDPEGGYVIDYPDLLGCMTQAEAVEEIPMMAEEARRLWIETAYEQGQDIPTPSYPEEYSGKFNLRLPRSLHRLMAEAADKEGVSLNQYAVSLLSRRDREAQIEKRLEQLDQRMEALHARVRVTGVP